MCAASVVLSSATAPPRRRACGQLVDLFRPMSGIRGDWSKPAHHAKPMRCERCGHPRALSSRPCFVTTPLRAAIGLQKALPGREDHSRRSRGRRHKCRRLRQHYCYQCCCPHHRCSTTWHERANLRRDDRVLAEARDDLEGRISLFKRRICPRFMAVPPCVSQSAN